MDLPQSRLRISTLQSSLILSLLLTAAGVRAAEDVQSIPPVRAEPFIRALENGSTNALMDYQALVSLAANATRREELEELIDPLLDYAKASSNAWSRGVSTFPTIVRQLPEDWKKMMLSELRARLGQPNIPRAIAALEAIKSLAWQPEITPSDITSLLPRELLKPEAPPELQLRFAGTLALLASHNADSDLFGRAFRVLVDFVRNGSVENKKTAIRALRQCQGVAPLTEVHNAAISEVSVTLLKEAAAIDPELLTLVTSLGGTPRIWPKVRKSIVENLGTSNPRQQLALLSGLAPQWELLESERTSTGPTDLLLELSKNADPIIRSDAIELRSRVRNGSPDDRLDQRIVEMLRDPDARVRAQATIAASRSSAPDMVGAEGTGKSLAISNTVEFIHSLEPLIRSNAIQAAIVFLPKVKDPSIRAELEHGISSALSDPVGDVREAAAHSIPILPEAPFIPPSAGATASWLLKNLDNADPLVRLRLLESIGVPSFGEILNRSPENVTKVFELFQNSLGDPYPQIRSAALAGLTRWSWSHANKQVQDAAFDVISSVWQSSNNQLFLLALSSISAPGRPPLLSRYGLGQAPMPTNIVGKEFQILAAKVPNLPSPLDIAALNGISVLGQASGDPSLEKEAEAFLLRSYDEGKPELRSHLLRYLQRYAVRGQGDNSAGKIVDRAIHALALPEKTLQRAAFQLLQQEAIKPGPIGRRAATSVIEFATGPAMDHRDFNFAQLEYGNLPARHNALWDPLARASADWLRSKDRFAQRDALNIIRLTAGQLGDTNIYKESASSVLACLQDGWPPLRRPVLLALPPLALSLNDPTFAEESARQIVAFLDLAEVDPRQTIFDVLTGEANRGTPGLCNHPAAHGIITGALTRHATNLSSKFVLRACLELIRLASTETNSALADIGWASLERRLEAGPLRFDETSDFNRTLTFDRAGSFHEGLGQLCLKMLRSASPAAQLRGLSILRGSFRLQTHDAHRAEIAGQLCTMLSSTNSEVKAAALQALQVPSGPRDELLEEKIMLAALPLLNDPDPTVVSRSLSLVSRHVHGLESREHLAAILAGIKPLLVQTNQEIQADALNVLNTLAGSGTVETSKLVEPFSPDLTKLAELPNERISVLSKIILARVLLNTQKTPDATKILDELKSAWSKKTVQSDLLPSLADLLVRSGQSREAIPIYKDLAASNRASEFYTDRLRQLYQSTGQTKEAESLGASRFGSGPFGTQNEFMRTSMTEPDLNKVLSSADQIFSSKQRSGLPPQSIAFQLTIRFEREGKLSELASHFEAKTKEHADNPAYKIALGGVYERQGKVDAAIALYEGVLQANPTRSDGRMQLVHLYQKTRQPEKALGLLEEQIENNPNSVHTYTQLAPLLRELGRTNQILKRAQELQRAGESGSLHGQDFYSAIGDLYMEASKFDEAIASYERGARSTRNDGGQAKEKLLAAYQRAGKSDAVKAYLDQNHDPDFLIRQFYTRTGPRDVQMVTNLAWRILGMREAKDYQKEQALQQLEQIYDLKGRRSELSQMPVSKPNQKTA